jgi:hypothetical protein
MVSYGGEVKGAKKTLYRTDYAVRSFPVNESGYADKLEPSKLPLPLDERQRLV